MSVTDRRYGLRSSAVVDLNETDAGAVVHSREQGGVKARRQRRRDARLESVCRRQTRGSQFGRIGRVILPVVVRDQERSITVAQLQGRIGQRVWYSRPGQAGTDTAQRRSGRRCCSPPRMKPAITMSLPVATKARVLMLPSFEAAVWPRS